ncbi:hypothetical protein BG61_06560 [Caballeronia glathei]|jgi:hypothetical protein|uniref:Uncharacterized protein n=1 Tax=Caballeronia glathei TaxID=60547 RepID=A0A069PQU7_9BURK|nr:hypothetical protein BG61_06560 [Caballeronia glathei]
MLLYFVMSIGWIGDIVGKARAGQVQGALARGNLRIERWDRAGCDRLLLRGDTQHVVARNVEKRGVPVDETKN